MLREGEGRVALVTGGTGFIGRAVASRLAGHGWRVRCAVRPESPRPTPPGAERVPARLATDDLVAACGRADLVVHAAGLTKAPNLKRFCRANVDGTREVAEAARRFGARLVHVSSQSAVGPASQQRPSIENDAPNPMTDYGISKRLAEDAVRSVPELRWTIIRPSAVDGPGDRAFLPLFRLARMGVFPLAGHPQASYTIAHVDDVARSIELAAAADAALGEIVFVGHPEAVTMAGLLAELARVFGRRFRPTRIPAPLAQGRNDGWRGTQPLRLAQESRSVALAGTPGGGVRVQRRESARDSRVQRGNRPQ